jgi:TolB protein
VNSKAELSIEITESIAGAVPMAVVPFLWQGKGALPEDLARIVSSDLARSGQFDTLAPGEMLSQPTTENDVYYRDWRLLKQDFLLIGRINQSVFDQRYEVTYELFDIVRQKKIFERNAAVTKEQLRSLGHLISDKVYEELTGLRGAFSTKLAYVTTDSSRKTFRLQIADADGINEQVLYKSPEPIISPAWSPDAQQIAYVSFESGRSEVFIQDIATGKRKKVAAFKGNNSSPAFSPNGRYLALVLSKDGNANIYMLELATNVLTQVTKHWGIDTEPSWMPDSKNIVFTSNRGGKPQIYNVDISTAKIKRITFEGSYNARARVTSDGKYLIMVHQQNKRFHIASQDLERGTVQILSTQTALDESPSIAPNGSMLVYATKYKGRSILAAVSIDGRVKFHLPAKYGDVREPAWSPYLN